MVLIRRRLAMSLFHHFMNRPSTFDWVNFLKSLLQQLVLLVKRHRVLAVVLSLLIVVFVAFSALIGFPLMVVLLVPVALIAWPLINRRIKKGGLVGGTAEALAFSSIIAISCVAVFAVIQLVPYGKSGTNPSNFDRKFEPDWDSPRTRELTVNACFGCHSNEVKYPSYSKIAPISWAVQKHIDEGRSEVNYSLAKQSNDLRDIGEESIEVIQEGSMPPSYYTRFGMHPEAKLTEAEKNELIQGLMKTFGVTGSGKDGYED